MSVKCDPAVVFTDLRSILIHQCFCKVHVEVVQWIVVLLFASVCCTYCMLKSGGVIRTRETQENVLLCSSHSEVSIKFKSWRQ